MIEDCPNDECPRSKIETAVNRRCPVCGTPLLGGDD